MQHYIISLHEQGRNPHVNVWFARPLYASHLSNQLPPELSPARRLEGRSWLRDRPALSESRSASQSPRLVGTLLERGNAALIFLNPVHPRDVREFNTFHHPKRHPGRLSLVDWRKKEEIRLRERTGGFPVRPVWKK